MLRGVLIESLNLALQLDQQRTTKAIFSRRRRNLHPAFADVVFLDVRALFALEADADVVLKALFNEVRATRVDGQMVWEFWFVVGHNQSLSRISIDRFNKHTTKYINKIKNS